MQLPEFFLSTMADLTASVDTTTDEVMELFVEDDPSALGELGEAQGARQSCIQFFKLQYV